MYESRKRLWLTFTVWVSGAATCEIVDRTRGSSLVLTVYFGLSILGLVAATWKFRPRNYKFEFVQPGVVRSPYGFEVRVSGQLLEYVEGDHTISWKAVPVSRSFGKVNISERGIVGWNPPFSAERLDDVKKREIAKAIKSALMYLQLIEAGKIRPKKRQN